jgi:glycosyltransferase involved in cell wall biosynthesis
MDANVESRLTRIDGDEVCPEVRQASRGLRRVAMITHSFYESDNRVLRYAQALAQEGVSVEVAALRRGLALPRRETLGGVELFRLQDRFDKTKQSKGAYLWPLLRFLLVSSSWITRRHARQRFDLVHIHNIPDFLVFAAWLPKLTGARIILDIHDIVPEFFASKFNASERSKLVRGLKLIEKASGRFADHVILSNHLWLDKYASRAAAREKCSVFINHVDTALFRRGDGVASKGKPVILFPGGLQWHQGLDIAIRAFAKLRTQLPSAEFHIYGEGNMKPALIKLAAEQGLNGSVRFFDPVAIKDVAGVMATASLGVVPKRADSFGNEAYSTKIMEFMALGVPVVVSSTKVDRHYFNDSVVRFFESGNHDALAQAMFEVLSNDDLRQGLVSRGLQYVAQNSWENHRAGYLKLANSLCR